MPAGLRWKQQNLPLSISFLSPFSPSQPLFNLIRWVSRTCTAIRVDPLMEVLSGEGAGQEDETWGAGNSILSGITHLLSAGCIMNDTATR